MLGLPRNLRNELYAGRSRADHADDSALEIDRMVRPLTRVVARALEGIQAGYGRRVRDDRHPLAITRKRDSTIVPSPVFTRQTSSFTL